MNFSKQDKYFEGLLKVLACFVVALLIAVIFLLTKASMPAIKEFGFGFLASKIWNPMDDQFGALPFIYGTLLTSTVALCIAAPVSISIALFINEVCSKRIGNILGLLVEMIAAIPSIVFGLWGIFYLAPFVRTDLAPFLKEFFGFLPIFKGPSFGLGYLTASLILSLMITPTITSICREVFRTIPRHQREAALGLGATKFEAIYLAVFRPSFSGMMGGIVLGLGRALGETMAVAMLIGNTARISTSLFSSGATMASVIANEYAEAYSDIHLASLSLVGVLLFVITLIVNALSRLIVWKYKQGRRA